MTAAYFPQPGTIASRALDHLRTLAPGADIANGPLADALGLNPNTMSVCLDTAAKRGVLWRQKREGRIYWSLGPHAPAGDRPPADDETADHAPDLAVKQVRVDASATSAPIAGLVRQSWCPAAQDSEAPISLDEPPAPPPARPGPPLGLGWKAPRTPVFLPDAPRAAREPGPDALSVTAAVLSAEDDPDFREVDRAPAPPEPNAPPKGAEAAQAPANSCGRDVATPNDGDVSQGILDPFRCALWSNGMLEILTTDGKTILLNQRDTRGLMRYVSETLSSRARAAA